LGKIRLRGRPIAHVFLGDLVGFPKPEEFFEPDRPIVVAGNVAFLIKAQEEGHFGARNASKILHFGIADYEAGERGLKRNMPEMLNGVRCKQHRKHVHVKERLSVANCVRPFRRFKF
jgi:hypothetical protein